MKNTWQFDQYILPALLSLTKEHNPRCPFAIKMENIVCVNDAKSPKNAVLEATNVIVPTSLRGNGDYLLEAMRFLREFYWDENFTGASERIYISREKSAKRKVKNEAALRGLLEQKYGFKTLMMEEVSFKDKVNFMSRAKVLLSVDGTSVMNYGYMQGGKAIALRPKNMAEYPIHSIFGVEFLPIVCEVVDSRDTDHMDGFVGDWWASNLIADLDYVEQKLAEYDVERVR